MAFGSKTFAKLSMIISANIGPAVEDMNRLARRANRMAQLTSTAGTRLSIGLTAPIIAGIGAVVKKTSDFEQAMLKIQNLTDASTQQVAAWGKAILDLAPKLSKAPQELAESLFFISSAGQTGAAGLAILQEAAKASAIGLGQTKDIAKLGAVALNVFGKSGLKAKDAINILADTILFGNVEASALATSFGRVVPFADLLGVKMVEVGAAIAVITRSGLNADQTVTGLRGLFASLLGPAEQSKGALKSVGKAMDLDAVAAKAMGGELKSLGLSGENLKALIKSDGLFAALRKLDGAFTNSTDSIRKLVPNVRALTAFLSLMRAPGNLAEAILGAMRDGTDTVGEGFEKFKGTFKGSMDTFTAGLNAAAIQLGDSFLPIIQQTFNVLQGLSAVLIFVGDAWAALPIAMQAIIATSLVLVTVFSPLAFIIGQIGVGVTALGVLFSEFATVLSTAGIVTVAGVFQFLSVHIRVAVAAFVLLSTAAGIFLKSAEELNRPLQDVGDALTRIEKQQMDQVGGSFLHLEDKVRIANEVVNILENNIEELNQRAERSKGIFAILGVAIAKAFQSVGDLESTRQNAIENLADTISRTRFTDFGGLIPITVEIANEGDLDGTLGDIANNFSDMMLKSLDSTSARLRDVLAEALGLNNAAEVFGFTAMWAEEAKQIDKTLSALDQAKKKAKDLNDELTLQGGPSKQVPNLFGKRDSKGELLETVSLVNIFSEVEDRVAKAVLQAKALGDSFDAAKAFADGMAAAIKKLAEADPANLSFELLNKEAAFKDFLRKYQEARADLTKFNMELEGTTVIAKAVGTSYDIQAAKMSALIGKMKSLSKFHTPQATAAIALLGKELLAVAGSSIKLDQDLSVLAQRGQILGVSYTAAADTISLLRGELDTLLKFNPGAFSAEIQDLAKQIADILNPRDIKKRALQEIKVDLPELRFEGAVRLSDEFFKLKANIAVVERQTTSLKEALVDLKELSPGKSSDAIRELESAIQDLNVKALTLNKSLESLNFDIDIKVAGQAQGPFEGLLDREQIDRQLSVIEDRIATLRKQAADAGVKFEVPEDLAKIQDSLTNNAVIQQVELMNEGLERTARVAKTVGVSFDLQSASMSAILGLMDSLANDDTPQAAIEIARLGIRFTEVAGSSDKLKQDLFILNETTKNLGESYAAASGRVSLLTAEMQRLSSINPTQFAPQIKALADDIAAILNPEDIKRLAAQEIQIDLPALKFEGAIELSDDFFEIQKAIAVSEAQASKLHEALKRLVETQPDQSSEAIRNLEVALADATSAAAVTKKALEELSFDTDIIVAAQDIGAFGGIFDTEQIERQLNIVQTRIAALRKQAAQAGVEFDIPDDLVSRENALTLEAVTHQVTLMNRELAGTTRVANAVGLSFDLQAAKLSTIRGLMDSLSSDIASTGQVTSSNRKAFAQLTEQLAQVAGESTKLDQDLLILNQTTELLGSSYVVAGKRISLFSGEMQRLLSLDPRRYASQIEELARTITAALNPTDIKARVREELAIELPALRFEGSVRLSDDFFEVKKSIAIAGAEAAKFQEALKSLRETSPIVSADMIDELASSFLRATKVAVSAQRIFEDLDFESVFKVAGRDQGPFAGLFDEGQIDRQLAVVEDRIDELREQARKAGDIHFEVPTFLADLRDDLTIKEIDHQVELLNEGLAQLERVARAVGVSFDLQAAKMSLTSGLIDSLGKSSVPEAIATVQVLGENLTDLGGNSGKLNDDLFVLNRTSQLLGESYEVAAERISLFTGELEKLKNLNPVHFADQIQDTVKKIIDILNPEDVKRRALEEIEIQLPALRFEGAVRLSDAFFDVKKNIAIAEAEATRLQEALKIATTISPNQSTQAIYDIQVAAIAATSEVTNLQKALENVQFDSDIFVATQSQGPFGGIFDRGQLERELSVVQARIATLRKRAAEEGVSIEIPLSLTTREDALTNQLVSQQVQLLSEGLTGLSRVAKAVGISFDFQGAEISAITGLMNSLAKDQTPAAAAAIKFLGEMLEVTSGKSDRMIQDLFVLNASALLLGESYVVAGKRIALFTAELERLISLNPTAYATQIKNIAEEIASLLTPEQVIQHAIDEIQIDLPALRFDGADRLSDDFFEVQQAIAIAEAKANKLHEALKTLTERFPNQSTQGIDDLTFALGEANEEASILKQKLESIKFKVDFKVGGEKQGAFGGFFDFGQIDRQLAAVSGQIDALRKRAAASGEDFVVPDDLANAENFLTAAQAAQDAWESAGTALGNTMGQIVSDMFHGTADIELAFAELGVNILSQWVADLTALLARWIFTNVLMRGVTVLSESIMTAAVTTGASVRAAAQAGEISVAVASIPAHIAKVGVQVAAEAPPVPDFGVSRLAAGIAAVAILTALVGSILAVKFAKKGGVLSEDQLVFAHKREMILPAHLSTGLQGLIQNGHSSATASLLGGGGLLAQARGDTNFYLSVVDKTGMENLIRRHGSAYAKEFRRQTRDKKNPALTRERLRS